MNGYVNMTNNYKQILLIGPIVFAELEDRISGKTALVIANEPAALEKYCDEQEVEYPSLMPTQDRWQDPIYAVDDGDVRAAGGRGVRKKSGDAAEGPRCQDRSRHQLQQYMRRQMGLT